MGGDGPQYDSSGNLIVPAVDNYTLEQEFRLYNPHLADEQTQDDWIINGILMPIFGGLSLLCNAFVFVVLFNKNRKNGKERKSFTHVSYHIISFKCPIEKVQYLDLGLQSA